MTSDAFDTFKSLRAPPPFRGFASPTLWAEALKAQVAAAGGDPAREILIASDLGGHCTMQAYMIEIVSADDLADAALTFRQAPHQTPQTTNPPHSPFGLAREKGKVTEMANKRINLELDDQAQSTLERLQKATNESMAHVLRDALGVYSALRDLLSENGPEAKLAIINRARHELQELSIPSLSPTTKHVVAGDKTKLSPRVL